VLFANTIKVVIRGNNRDRRRDTVCRLSTFRETLQVRNIRSVSPPPLLLLLPSAELLFFIVLHKRHWTVHTRFGQTNHSFSFYYFYHPPQHTINGICTYGRYTYLPWRSTVKMQEKNCLRSVVIPRDGAVAEVARH